MALTTGSEVKTVAGFTNEYSDTEILTEIDLAEAELYQKYKLPKRGQFSVDDDYTDFYVSEGDIHEIIRVQAQVDTSTDPSGFLEIPTSGSTWTHTTSNKYITLDSAFISSYDNKIIRVQFTPKIHNILASNITALNLLDATTIIDGEEATPPLVTRIKARIDRLKKHLSPKSILRSSAYSDFDQYDYVSLTQGNFR